MEGSMTVLISFNDIKQSLSIDFFIYIYFENSKVSDHFQLIFGD